MYNNIYVESHSYIYDSTLFMSNHIYVKSCMHSHERFKKMVKISKLLV